MSTVNPRRSHFLMMTLASCRKPLHRCIAWIEREVAINTVMQYRYVVFMSLSVATVRQNRVSINLVRCASRIHMSTCSDLHCSYSYWKRARLIRIIWKYIANSTTYRKSMIIWKTPRIEETLEMTRGCYTSFDICIDNAKGKENARINH